MTQVSRMLMQLNLETRRYHAEVDEPWIDLLRPTVSIQDYLAVLVRTYGLIAPFESACHYTPGLARLVDFKQLMRAGMIAQDLLSLGLAPQQVSTIPTCPKLDVFSGIHEALGWLYVVERSTLLHDGVRRHLREHLPVESACTYLAAYEGHISDHWAGFGRALDRVASSPEIANEIVEASCKALDVSAHWLRNMPIETRNVG